jgi:predicted ribosome quality control (RQC) complex YloA/Tae2 family protein
VILRAKEDEKPGKDILKEAAAIAAWHSKAKGGGITPVSCTMAKYVSKPKGAKPACYNKKGNDYKGKAGIPNYNDQ